MARGEFARRPCALAGVEAIEADTRHAFARHTHEHFGIGLIARGAQKSHSGRGPVEAGPGDIITVNPGEVHDGAPIGDAGRRWAILYLDPEVVAGAVADIDAGPAGWREFGQPVIRSRAVADGFRRLYAAATAPCQGARTPAAESLLLALLARTLELRPASQRGTPSAAIAQARALIDDDPAAALSLADLAHASGLSRFQVLRAFARSTGLTPHAYQLQRRIGLARRLIAGGAALSEAAAASGFADQSHMTRVFVRQYGITPGSYARDR